MCDLTNPRNYLKNLHIGEIEFSLHQVAGADGWFSKDFNKRHPDAKVEIRAEEVLSDPKEILRFRLKVTSLDITKTFNIAGEVFFIVYKMLFPAEVSPTG